LDDVTLLVFPFHDGKLHWSLGLVDKAQRLIIHFDSIPMRTRSFNLFKTMTKKLLPLLGWEHADWRNLSSHTEWDTQTQKGDTDCGVFVVHWLNHICLGEMEKARASAINPTLVRGCIAQCLVDQTATALKLCCVVE